MKKILLLIAFISLSSIVFAETGIGVAFTYGLNTGAGGAALNICHEKIPGDVLGVTAAIATKGVHIGIYDDFYVIEPQLIDYVNWYLGVGGFLSFAAANEEVLFSIGARLPIGLRYRPMKELDIFLEIAPALAPISSTGVYIAGDSLSFQGALGIRFWF